MQELKSVDEYISKEEGKASLIAISKENGEAVAVSSDLVVEGVPKTEVHLCL